MICAIDMTIHSGKWHTKPYAVETSFLCLHDVETAYGDDYYGCYTVATLQKLKKKDTHCTEIDISYYVLIRLQPRRIRKD
jgi:hypothetical protein